MLTSSQERQTSEQIRVPEGNLLIVDSLGDEVFPDIVLQNEVAEQLIVGDAHTPLAGKGSPGLESEEVVHGQKGPATEGYWPEEYERKEQKEKNDQQIQLTSLQQDPLSIRGATSQAHVEVAD